MPQQIPVQAIVKQSLQVELNGNLYTLNIIQTQGCMSMDIISETAGLNLLAQRCNAASLVIPFQESENGAGNFIFITANDELPDYEEFGLTQSLYYLTDAELAPYRTNPQTILALLSTAGTITGAAVVAGVT